MEPGDVAGQSEEVGLEQAGQQDWRSDSEVSTNLVLGRASGTECDPSSICPCFDACGRGVVH